MTEMVPWPWRRDPLHDGGPLPLFCPRCGRKTEPWSWNTVDGLTTYDEIVCWGGGLSGWLARLVNIEPLHFRFTVRKRDRGGPFDPLTGRKA